MAMRLTNEKDMGIRRPTGNESDSESSEDSSPRAQGEKEGEAVGSGQGVGSRDTVRMDDAGFLPPPSPRGRTGITETQDVGKIYTDLIHDCNSQASHTTSNKDFCEFMSDNLKVGRNTLNFMMGNTSSSQGSSSSGGVVRRSTVGPGDMYLALQHTKVASDLIRVRAERIGSGPNIFSVDTFLENLKGEFKDENGDYFPKLAAANIAMQVSHGSYSAVPIVSIFDNYFGDETSIPTPKKAGPKRSIPTEEETQEGTSVEEGRIIPVAENNPAEHVAKTMMKILKIAFIQSSKPVNLFEFAFDRTSFPKTIENLFYFSYLVQDGNASITKEENGPLKDLSVTIKPEESQNPETKSPEEEEEGVRNQTVRSTYIVSFSAKQWKELAAMCQGENTVSYIQSLMEK